MTTETPEERKARLDALRLAVELSSTPDTEDAGGEHGAAAATDANVEDAEINTEEPEPVLRFRNYVPRDESLQVLKVAPLETVKFEDPVASVPDEVEEPTIIIAPKKANWDLRRDVAKKLTKLERRTQRALIQLMQEEEKRRQAASVAVEEAEDGSN